MIRKTIVKESVTYGFAAILSRLSGFLLVPLYTRLLDIDDYGLLDLCVATTTALTIVFESQIASGLMRSYYEVEERGRLFGAGISYYLLSWIALLLLTLLFAPLLLDTAPMMSQGMVAAIVLAILPIQVFQLVLITVRLEHEPKIYLVLSVGQTVAGAAFGLTAVVIFDQGVLGVLIANAASHLLFATIGLVRVRGMQRIQLGWYKLREMLSYGLPIVPAVFTAWCNTYINRFFLSTSISLAAVGVFSVASRVGAMLLLAVYALRMVWEPYLMKLFGEEDSEAKISKVFDYYVVVYFGFLILLVAVSPWVIRFLAPPEYGAAVLYVPLLLLASYLEGMAQLFASGNAWERKTYLNTIAAVSALIVTIGVLFATLEWLGVGAAALAAALASMTKSLTLLATSQMIRYIPYSRRSVISSMGLAVVASALAISGLLALQEKPATFALATVLVGLGMLLFLMQQVGRSTEQLKPRALMRRLRRLT